ncbi:hypothetical protein J6590_019091 [Homalodisca vitripennis]|nr:hypothetical protein J6590_019091 [Homalodisca vitripennis]
MEIISFIGLWHNLTKPNRNKVFWTRHGACEVNRSLHVTDQCELRYALRSSRHRRIMISPEVRRGASVCLEAAVFVATIGRTISNTKCLPSKLTVARLPLHNTIRHQIKVEQGIKTPDPTFSLYPSWFTGPRNLLQLAVGLLPCLKVIPRGTAACENNDRFSHGAAARQQPLGKHDVRALVSTADTALKPLALQIETTPKKKETFSDFSD